MAAATCHTKTLRVVQSHRVTLDNQAVRICRAGASLGARCGAGARLRATGVDPWVHRSSRGVKFAAEGSLNESAVSKVIKALEGTEGVSQVEVCVDEGAATVELVKQTNIQATGVASSLVEIIEQAGFKMQALSLGFDDDGAEDDEYIDDDASTYTEEEEATSE